MRQRDVRETAQSRVNRRSPNEKLRPRTVVTGCRDIPLFTGGRPERRRDRLRDLDRGKIQVQRNISGRYVRSETQGGAWEAGEPDAHGHESQGEISHSSARPVNGRARKHGIRRGANVTSDRADRVNRGQGTGTSSDGALRMCLGGRVGVNDRHRERVTPSRSRRGCQNHCGSRRLGPRPPGAWHLVGRARRLGLGSGPWTARMTRRLAP